MEKCRRVAFCQVAVNGDRVRPPPQRQSCGMRTENKSIRVLLVEDDLPFARAVKECLSALSAARIDLIILQTLSEALSRLKQERFDAVLTDLSLSDSQGLRTFALIHAQAPTAPIIILAGCDNEQLALEASLQSEAGRSDDFLEGVTAFREKRAPRFLGR